MTRSRVFVCQPACIASRWRRSGITLCFSEKSQFFDAVSEAVTTETREVNSTEMNNWHVCLLWSRANQVERRSPTKRTSTLTILQSIPNDDGSIDLGKHSFDAKLSERTRQRTYFASVVWRLVDSDRWLKRRPVPAERVYARRGHRRVDETLSTLAKIYTVWCRPVGSSSDRVMSMPTTTRTSSPPLPPRRRRSSTSCRMTMMRMLRVTMTTSNGV